MPDDDTWQVRPYGRAALSRMSDEDLSAIDGFEVAAPGRGRLRWPGRTDVRGVLGKLGDILPSYHPTPAILPSSYR